MGILPWRHTMALPHGRGGAQNPGHTQGGLWLSQGLRRWEMGGDGKDFEKHKRKSVDCREQIVSRHVHVNRSPGEDWGIENLHHLGWQHPNRHKHRAGRASHCRGGLRRKRGTRCWKPGEKRSCVARPCPPGTRRRPYPGGQRSAS